jgi:hypothetical protein
MSRDSPSSQSGETSVTPTDPAARRLLTESLVAELAAEERALGPAEFEELAAAVEGTLDAPARAVWEERLARDPGLARRAAELSAFAREAWPQAAPAPRRAPLAWRWAAGVAAALLLALLVAGRGGEQPRHAPAAVPATGVAAALPAPSTPAPAATIFADGFESGDASRWVSSPSG